MYESFYGLKENPFNLHPDPEYLFMSSGHEDAYSHLVYAIAENKGFVIITGEIGSGKTTLLNYLLREIPQNVVIGLINNTYLSPTDFIKTMCREYEIEFEGLDRTAIVARFHEFLLEQYALKKRVVLIIDEAQNLTPRTMETIRMLSNLESEKNHLIQIILVGQPELKYKLQRRDLQQFAQRVTVHCHLDALNLAEVEEYIKYRLRIGGAKDTDLFDPGALEAIAKYSRGIPRLINILCDTGLVYGFADTKDIIDRQTIEDVVHERASGGIFLPDTVLEPEKAAEHQLENSPAVQDEYKNNNNGTGALRERIESLEQKIGHLEVVLDSMNKGLMYLSKKKEEKDLLVLELFRMLKSSMDNRYKVLQSFSDFQKKAVGKENIRS